MNETKELSWQQSILRYRIAGTGEAVILLHGFGEDATVFDRQAMLLAKRYKVILPDLPGSGASDLQPYANSMDDYAESLKAVLDQEEIKHCVFIGHSMGGYIALAFEEKFPDVTKGFGLFHSSAYADDEEKIASRKKGIQFIREHGSEKFLAQAIPNLFSEKTRSEQPSLIQELISRYANFNPEALVQYYDAMIVRPDRTHVLKNTGKPVLFILGEFDTAIPLLKGLEQTILPGICYIHICHKSGHMAMLEEAKICDNALVEFIAAVLS